MVGLEMTLCVSAASGSTLGWEEEWRDGGRGMREGLRVWRKEGRSGMERRREETTRMGEKSAWKEQAMLIIL